MLWQVKSSNQRREKGLSFEKYHFWLLKAHENSSETITHPIKNFLKSYSIFSALVFQGIMLAKRTHGLARHALDYPSYLISHFQMKTVQIINFYFFIKKHEIKHKSKAMGSLIKLLNTLQRSQINLIFIFETSIDRWSWACMLYFLKIQTANERRNGNQYFAKNTKVETPY